MDISNLSTEDLKKELVRRETIKKTIPQKLPPSEIAKNMSGIISLAESMVKERANQNSSDEDDPQWCFEAVLSAVYGESIWNWWNNVCK